MIHVARSSSPFLTCPVESKYYSGAQYSRCPQFVTAELCAVDPGLRANPCIPGTSALASIRVPAKRCASHARAARRARAAGRTPPSPLADGRRRLARRSSDSFSNDSQSRLHPRHLDVGFARSMRSSSGPEICRVSFTRLIAADHGVGAGAFLYRVPVVLVC
jgi:hypothetical protein